MKSLPETRLPPGYCAAPWTEAVVRLDREVLPCCRLNDSMGSTASASLSEIWRGSRYREFRMRIAEGAQPTRHCGGCYADGKATTLHKLFDADLALHWRSFESACNAAHLDLPIDLCEAVTRFHETVNAARSQRHSSASCREFIGVVFRHRNLPIGAVGRQSLRRMAAIARTCVDYLEASLVPRRLAPMRQVNLIAKCNARCVHCVGLYTGEIERGVESNGRRIKRMSEEEQSSAFERAGDISGFFMNGSEFLLYPRWRDLIRTFARKRTLLALATNGMLLDREAAILLVEADVLRDINFSFDGASAAVVEKIRAGVEYERLLAHMEGFLEVQAASGRGLSVSMSMVLLKDNAHEAAQLVELAARMRRDRALDVHVSFELLNPAINPGYAQFVAEQRTDIHDEATAGFLRDALQRGERLGIGTYYTYQGTLRMAVDALEKANGAPRRAVPLVAVGS